jgi:hypothetical protein
MGRTPRGGWDVKGGCGPSAVPVLSSPGPACGDIHSKRPGSHAAWRCVPCGSDMNQYRLHLPETLLSRPPVLLPDTHNNPIKCGVGPPQAFQSSGLPTSRDSTSPCRKSLGQPGTTGRSVSNHAESASAHISIHLSPLLCFASHHVLSLATPSRAD